MNRQIVIVAATLLVASAPALAQTGLLTSTRERAAMGKQVILEAAPGYEWGSDWSVGDPVVDEFTDERGQAAYLIGVNARLVLIVGCNASRVSVVGLGGLGGARTFRGRLISPNVVFQGGDVDLRWGEGPIQTRSWVDGDVVLAASGQAAADFLDASSQENRLRVRAGVVRNSVIQDEFDLSDLAVSADDVRMIGRTEELHCTR